MTTISLCTGAQRTERVERLLCVETLWDPRLGVLQYEIFVVASRRCDESLLTSSRPCPKDIIKTIILLTL